MHTVILLDFIDVFCMDVNFYYVPFRQSSTGPMSGGSVITMWASADR